MAGDCSATLPKAEDDGTLTLKDSQGFLYQRRLTEEDLPLLEHLKVGARYTIWTEGLTSTISSIEELDSAMKTALK